jgi:hypothetical protein
LRVASGLSTNAFAQFATALDFSECQGPSRFEIHRQVVEAISRGPHSESRQVMWELRNVVYQRMLPAHSSPITRAVILGALSVGDPWRCYRVPRKSNERPTSFRERPSPTWAASCPTIQRVCLHGEGGQRRRQQRCRTRRSTSCQFGDDVFDCYGAGRYLDSDGQRHLARHALLHLCNEVAARLGAPMLVVAFALVGLCEGVQHEAPDGSRKSFGPDPKTRCSSSPSMLTDNSVTAALSRVPQERSFVHDVMQAG